MDTAQRGPGRAASTRDTLDAIQTQKTPWRALARRSTGYCLLRSISSQFPIDHKEQNKSQKAQYHALRSPGMYSFKAFAMRLAIVLDIARATRSGPCNTSKL